MGFGVSGKKFSSSLLLVEEFCSAVVDRAAAHLRLLGAEAEGPPTPPPLMLPPLGGAFSKVAIRQGH